MFLVGHVVFMLPRFARARRSGSWPGSVRVLDIATPVSFLLAFISQIFNALGIGLPQSAGGFLIGIYLLLLISGLNFAFLMYVLVRPGDESPAAQQGDARWTSPLS